MPIGSFEHSVVLCGEGIKCIRTTVRMTRQVNLFHMLNVLCCRVEGGKYASVCRGFQVKQVKVVTYNVLSFTHVFFSLSL